jgi:dTDP-4-amino-4,6-dideoxygalactose transaminase
LSVFHYLPLHLSEMGRSFGGKRGTCPVTEDVSQRIVRLPMFNDLAEDQQVRVVNALSRFYKTQPVGRSVMALSH